MCFYKGLKFKSVSQIRENCITEVKHVNLFIRSFNCLRYVHNKMPFFRTRNATLDSFNIRLAKLQDGLERKNETIRTLKIELQRLRMKSKKLDIWKKGNRAILEEN